VGSVKGADKARDQGKQKRYGDIEKGGRVVEKAKHILRQPRNPACQNSHLKGRPPTRGVLKNYHPSQRGLTSLR